MLAIRTELSAGDAGLQGAVSEYIAKRTGTYPHATLDSVAIQKKLDEEKQGTRMLKVFCPECDYTVRTTKKWIDVGLPTCPCGAQMQTETGDEGED